MIDQAPGSNDHDPAGTPVPPHPVYVRLIRRGEGTSAVAIAAAANAPGAFGGGPLQAALDHSGGHITFPGLQGGGGWCFGAFTGARMIGMLYACSPVTFIQTFQPNNHARLTGSLVEIEILAVDDSHRGRGAGTALLTQAEQHFREIGIELIIAKVDAADRQVLLWYRRRGYTLARNGESCFIRTPEGPAGINAGPADGAWRLAAKATSSTITRNTTGLWLTKTR